MKKIVLLLIAALLLCAFAAAETVETPDYALTLPEGFAAVSEEEMDGYREASARCLLYTSGARRSITAPTPQDSCSICGL